MPHSFADRYSGIKHWSCWSPQKISFYQKRKDWAYELFEESGQPWETGCKVSGTFQGLPYTIQIGPRGGLQVEGPKPEYFAQGGTACWRDRKGEPHLYPELPDKLVKLNLPCLTS